MDEARAKQVVIDGDAQLKELIDARMGESKKMEIKEAKALAEIIGLRSKVAIAAARASSEANVNDAIAMANRAMTSLLSPSNMKAVAARHMSGQGLGEVVDVPVRIMQIPDDLPDVEILPGELDAVVLRAPESFD